MTFLLIYQETVLAVLNDKDVNNLEKAEKVFAANYFTTMLAHNHDELKSEEIDEDELKIVKIDVDENGVISGLF